MHTYVVIYLDILRELWIIVISCLFGELAFLLIFVTNAFNTCQNYLLFLFLSMACMNLINFFLILEGDYAGTQGLGLLRLHSTYRHDLKIYASDEGIFLKPNFILLFCVNM